MIKMERDEFIKKIERLCNKHGYDVDTLECLQHIIDKTDMEDE